MKKIAISPHRPCARSVFHREMMVELQLHVKSVLAPCAYPKEIEVIDALPMTTTTGKVQRHVLRLQEEARFNARIADP